MGQLCTWNLVRVSNNLGWESIKWRAVIHCHSVLTLVILLKPTYGVLASHSMADNLNYLWVGNYLAILCNNSR